MRRITVLMIALASFGLAAPPAGAGLVCAKTISIDNLHYSPATALKVAQSDVFAVCWHNDDDVNHTATANRGFFDTDVIMPGNGAGAAFYGAGGYPYHCEIHASMEGALRIRPAVSDTSITLGDSITLTVGRPGS